MTLLYTDKEEMFAYDTAGSSLTSGWWVCAGLKLGMGGSSLFHVYAGGTVLCDPNSTDSWDRFLVCKDGREVCQCRDLSLTSPHPG